MKQQQQKDFPLAYSIWNLVAVNDQTLYYSMSSWSAKPPLNYRDIVSTMNKWEDKGTKHLTALTYGSLHILTIM